MSIIIDEIKIDNSDFEVIQTTFGQGYEYELELKSSDISFAKVYDSNVNIMQAQDLLINSYLYA